MAAFLSLAVPGELMVARPGKRSWVNRFFDGLLALAERTDVALCGGDTAESPALGKNVGLVAADIVLVGGVKRGRALLRSGARIGDLIYVTSAVDGGLGGATAELLAIERKPRKFARLGSAASGHPHLYPDPRNECGLRLSAGRLATAAIDLSDGLSSDLRHLCIESGLAAEIDAAAIPLHPMAQLAEAAGWVGSALDLALHGGEDYEILFTAPEKVRMPRKIGGVLVRAIGRMVPGGSDARMVRIRWKDGKDVELPPGGWEHFRR